MKPLVLSLLLALAPTAAHAQARPTAAELRRDFDATLREAQDGIATLRAQYPGRADLESVRRQLDQVAEWTRGGRRPGAYQVKLLSFGVIAAREIEPLDLPLARKLQALAHYLTYWPRASTTR